MTSFAAEVAAWQSFYILAGTAAATLVGLMFVAVTFGAGLVTPQSAPSARAFLDPPFAHFVTVLFASCVMVIPVMRPLVAGALLVGVAALRGWALVGIRRRMIEAHQRYNDLELSDWLMGVVLPAACYLVLVAAAAAFFAGSHAAFICLAVAVVAILLVGIFAAWELMIWLALTRANAKDASRQTG